MVRRFGVALSFPGEHRAFVEQIANDLASALTKERVFYDRFFEAELSRPNLDTYLQKIYHDDSELVVIFLCKEYNEEEWCGLEFRAIRDLIKKRHDDEIMFVRLADGAVKGVFEIDGYLDVRNRPASDIAQSILDRLKLIQSFKPLSGPQHRAVPERDGLITSATSGKLRIMVSKLPRTGEHLVGRDSELAILDDAWVNSPTSIVQIVAPGGVGKTQLVKKWQERLLNSEDHGGTIRAFDWSFYSQGTQQQASTDEFFDRALRWFGETEPENFRDPWVKGERLAELVKQQRTLLILDGLEPLQHPPGPMEGELSDPSIQILLEGLRWGNPGLCILTSRVTVRTLDEMNEPQRLTINLKNLSPDAGADLLERYGVKGDTDELRQASVDVEGHALALILLGSYLKRGFGGDVVRRADALLFAGAERYAHHAHRIMASYEAWLEQEDDIGRTAVAILRLMGLFNRPADAGCLAVLRAEPPIPGLTEALFVDSRDEFWTRAVERLRTARLIADDADSNQQSLDAHPLIREYFADQLVAQLPEAAREAHSRLYEHLKSIPKDELPNNLNDMMPLYHAVMHGCKALMFNDVVNDVYIPRILRGNECFSIMKLGGCGIEISTLANFYESLWDHVHPKLSHSITILACSAYSLRAIGRTTDALGPMKATVETALDIGDLAGAARSAGNLSETHVLLGQMGDALLIAEQAVMLAEQSNEHIEKRARYANLGYVLHFIDEPDVSEPAFRKAERVHIAEGVSSQWLHFTEGFWFCELLLSKVEKRVWSHSVLETKDGLQPFFAATQSVRERAESALSISKSNSILFCIGLDHYTLGRAYLIDAAIRMHSSLPGLRHGQPRPVANEIPYDDLGKAEYHLKLASKYLRESDYNDHLPIVLLGQASLCGLQAKSAQLEGMRRTFEAKIAEAFEFCADAKSIAARGLMICFLIDTAVEQARLNLFRKDVDGARKSIEIARTLIMQTEGNYMPFNNSEPLFHPSKTIGYYRRNLELQILTRYLSPY